jgi:hypothetical protein
MSRSLVRAEEGRVVLLQASDRRDGAAAVVVVKWEQVSDKRRDLATAAEMVGS